VPAAQRERGLPGRQRGKGLKVAELAKPVAEIAKPSDISDDNISDGRASEAERYQ
jgi:hypothetical protein